MTKNDKITKKFKKENAQKRISQKKSIKNYQKLNKGQNEDQPTNQLTDRPTNRHSNI